MTGPAEPVEGMTASSLVTRSVMHRPGEKARPNCLILDEIDGALEGSDGKGAISELIKVCGGRTLSSRAHLPSCSPLQQ